MDQKSTSDRIKHSLHFQNGAFRNLSVTPMKPENVTYIDMLKRSLNRPSDVKPGFPLPVVKTDLHTLKADAPTIVWFGHSSYFIKVHDFTILVDPVFSGSAAPFSFMIKAFPGTNTYRASDMPEIDMLIITHNHYDHLDKKTLAQLSGKVKSVYTPLGVAKDLIDAFSADIITEMDWWESNQVQDEINITATPARHFSGRGLKRGGSLWASFVLRIFGYNLFLGGDSGYDSHFKEIGNKYGPFDLVILENGQYNEYWPYIHMMPEETVEAAIDLQAKALLPVHWGKFALSVHPWNESPERVTRAAAEKHLLVTTPKIGQPVIVGSNYPQDAWWRI
ncbi:MBL fold metallo-hydrolase [Chitinophaga silvatica]|uniref:MBL fold metallo-hydrolase n=1 Tax=Chitinophaga silvatica TaxID=2282649 RepID=A0A3E1Y4Q3_9BACT|nr:MBL fold metallo-hydrolase [Chitinophaga silvatica]RFS19643.1 MBL fold metallo-hydrolase [Chitinophaga silvatica]